MNVVTAAMREQRRARRAVARAGRGVPPHRHRGPRPALLIREGWSPARAARLPEPDLTRLLGAMGPAVLVAERARVAVADREAGPFAVPPLPVANGPLPADPAPALALGLGSVIARTAPAAEPATEPVVEDVAKPVAEAVPEAAPTPEAVPDTAVEPEAEPVAATAEPEVASEPEVVAAPEAEPEPTPPASAAETDAPEPIAPDAPPPTADLPPGPWQMPASEPTAPESVAPVETPAATPPAPPAVPAAEVPVLAAAAALNGSSTVTAVPVPTPPAADPPKAATVVPAPPSGHTSPREPSPSDLFAHALGLSPANSPAPEPPPAPARERRSFRTPRAPRAYDDPRPRGRLLLAAAGVVVLAGAATAVGFAVTGGSDGGTSTPTSTAPAAVTGSVATWLSGNISTDRRIVATDAGLASDLNADGVPVDTVANVSDARVGVIVVSAPPTGQSNAVQADGANLSIVALASFDDGTQQVSVGQVVQGGAEQIRADLDKGASTAAAACRGLNTNAAVTIVAAVQPVFDAGTLDLRASTLLALIAQSQPVQVVATPQDPAERAADRPVRTLVVKVQDPAEVRSAAAAARAPFSPEVNEPTAALDVPAGSLVLTWPVDATATLPVS